MTGAPQVIEFFSKRVDHAWLSNFYPCRIMLDGKVFSSSEAIFAFLKFAETAPDHAEMIRLAPTPSAAKKLGRSRQHPIRHDWPTYRHQAMELALRLKFEQNHNLRGMLLATGDAELREANPWDSTWSIGRDGKGQNLLGKALMRLRGELRSQAHPTIPMSSSTPRSRGHAL